MINIPVPTLGHFILIETEVEIGIETEKEREIEIGAEQGQGLEIRVVHATSILETLATLVDVIDVLPIRKMEEIIDIQIPTVIARLVPAMIGGRSNLEMIVGKRVETITEWGAVAVAGRMTEMEVEEAETKSIGRFPQLETSDWRWNYLVLVILVSILVNTRIYQLRLLAMTYHHTSHRSV